MMNTLTPLHLEHLEYTLKRLSNALTNVLVREPPPCDMQPLIHCLDILDKGVRRTALVMTGAWLELKMAEAHATQEVLGPQSRAETLVMDEARSVAALDQGAAKGFFSSLPWQGAEAATPDDSSTLRRVNPEQPTVIGSENATPSPTAADYFSSLPWQNEEPPPPPTEEREPLHIEPGASTPSPTAADYFSSLPWQNEEPPSPTEEHAPLHIEPGASALRGKQRVRAPASNPILAATHSAIETARSARSDSHADNLPQGAKHRPDQTVEESMRTRRQDHEDSSSDDEPAQTP